MNTENTVTEFTLIKIHEEMLTEFLQLKIQSHKSHHFFMAFFFFFLTEDPAL